MPFVPITEEKKYFEAFRGFQPSNIEMNRWPEEKFLSLIDFFRQFISPETNKWSVKKDLVHGMYTRFGETNENIYWREFLIRINEPEGKKAMAFTQRLRGMNRVLGIFLHRNPAFITPKVEEACKGTKELEWLVETFKEEKTKQDTDIVVQTDTVGKTGMSQKTPEILYQASIYKALDLFHNILGSISAHDIKKMSTKEKLEGIGKLAFVLNTAKSNKTKSQVFIGLNVGKENRASLEEKLMEYTEEQEKLSE